MILVSKQDREGTKGYRNLFLIVNPAVLKLGVATLLGVAKLLKRVAKYQNLEFFNYMA